MSEELEPSDSNGEKEYRGSGRQEKQDTGLSDRLQEAPAGGGGGGRWRGRDGGLATMQHQAGRSGAAVPGPSACPPTPHPLPANPPRPHWACKVHASEKGSALVLGG